MKILFVCLGNICRSPMAEGIYNHLVPGKKADSAGTAAYHIGERPDHRTLKELKTHGIETPHLAQKVRPEHFDQFDYLVAMDRSNYEDLLAISGSQEHKVLLMRDFDPQVNDGNVPDPYYGGQSDFTEVYEILDRSIKRMIEELGV